MRLLILFATLAISNLTFSQKKKAKEVPPQNLDKKTVISNIDGRFNEYAGISKQLWDFAELGYMEEKSSIVLQELLKKEVLFKSDVETLIGKRPYEEKKALDIIMPEPEKTITEEPDTSLPEELVNPPKI